MVGAMAQRGDRGGSLWYGPSNIISRPPKGGSNTNDMITKLRVEKRGWQYPRASTNLTRNNLMGGLLMEDIASIFGATFCFAVFIGIVVGVAAILAYLVKKTREEETAAKVELQEIVSDLPSDKQATFFIQYNAQRKNPTTAVVLALLLGAFGAHKFYLGQTGMGILYLVFFWTYIPGIVGFIEAFTISRTVIRQNREAARETMAMLGGDVAPLLR